MSSRPAVVPYRAGWPARADRLITTLDEVVGGAVDRIEHIGSTAIPGMAAKDILDLQASVPDLDAADLALAEPLALLGYTSSPHRHDHVPAGRQDEPSQWS